MGQMSAAKRHAKIIAKGGDIKSFYSKLRKKGLIKRKKIGNSS